MNNKTCFKAIGLTLSFTLVSACTSIANNEITTKTEKTVEQKATIPSSIVSFEDAHQTPYDHSVFHSYFMGDTTTTKDAIVGIAIIEPGHEIHPPHKHEDEEYLFIIEGSGVWTLNGVETPAKAGDVLYVSPWDMHGIFNTGNVTMKFFVARAKSKTVTIQQ
ncbi:cupin domain-containing protein [Colwellia sp. MSW7]|uniref:Cupin domain-containing protein n=1 Tax=Colwellia maritima TaxID=2912588 RepID=A0ABS9X4W4_9GAMM|nr:cupin domain-containing protein [Colwellia maritima]MCI2285269.1 cupin domain-containing protein [Colwellia maritima]